jgi:hypothetical protein
MFGARRPAVAARMILHGASGRAYSFEVHDRAQAMLPDGGAVYVYARRTKDAAAQASAAEASAPALDVGYIGQTPNMAWQDGEHTRLGHFTGHAFDTVLVVPIEEPAIRADLARDLIARHRPVLNDLLRSDEALVS